MEALAAALRLVVISVVFRSCVLFLVWDVLFSVVSVLLHRWCLLCCLKLCCNWFMFVVLLVFRIYVFVVVQGFVFCELCVCCLCLFSRL